MPIKVGTTDIKTPFPKVYAGNTLVYMSGDYIATELKKFITTQSDELIKVTIGMCVDESNNQIITEDGNEWEVE